MGCIVQDAGNNRPVQILKIPFLLPGLNDLLAARGRFGLGARWKGRNFDLYNQIKRDHQDNIYWLILNQKIGHVDQAYLKFCWYEKKKNRNKDNIAAGGRKIILDALVKAGVLKNDGWSEVTGWEDRFEAHSQYEGVLVSIYANGEGR